MRIPFVGPAYQHRSLNISAQRCVNLYPEKNEAPPGKEGEEYTLVNTPGLKYRWKGGTVRLVKDQTIFSSAPEEFIQGLHAASDGYLYMVAGGLLYRTSNLNADPATMDICSTYGTTYTGPVTIADNGLIVVVAFNQRDVVGVVGTYLNLATLDSGLIYCDVTLADVKFIDGYFIFRAPGTGKFYISRLYEDGLSGVVTINALDFATAEASPDNLLALEVNNREVWLFGDRSTEVYYNAGSADFPFERINNAVIEVGCAAPLTPRVVANSILWLGRDREGQGVVWQATGYVPQRVSTHAVEQLIQSFGDLSDAISYVYQQEGHSFYVLNFTSAATTLVYDLSTGLWHERSFTNPTNGEQERHRPQHHVFYDNQNIVSDYGVFRLYTLDPSQSFDYIAPSSSAPEFSTILRLRAATHVSKNLNQLYFASLQLDAEVGAGLENTITVGSSGTPADIVTAGLNPTAYLRWSDDGGHTWSDYREVSVGMIGRYRARALWRRLGRSRDRVFEISMTAPVKAIWLGTEINVLAGEH